MFSNNVFFNICVRDRKIYVTYVQKHFIDYFFFFFNAYFNKDEIDLHTCGKNHLKKRKDDSKEAIITRYDTYMKKTKPVLDFYSSKKYFHEIDGSQKIEVITDKIEHIIYL